MIPDLPSVQPAQVIEIGYRGPGAARGKVGSVAAIQSPAGPCRISLDSNRDINGNVFVLDLTLHCRGVAGGAELLSDAAPWSGLQPFNFSGNDAGPGTVSQGFGRTRNIEVVRAGLNLKVEVVDGGAVKIAPTGGSPSYRTTSLDLRVSATPLRHVVELAAATTRCAITWPVVGPGRTNAAEARCGARTVEIAKGFSAIKVEKLGSCRASILISAPSPRLFAADDCGGGLKIEEAGAARVNALLKDRGIVRKAIEKVSYEPQGGRPGCYTLVVTYDLRPDAHSTPFGQMSSDICLDGRRR